MTLARESITDRCLFRITKTPEGAQGTYSPNLGLA